MAEIKVSCSQCGQHIQCDEAYRGTQINCPKCNTPLLIPAAEQTAKTGHPIQRVVVSFLVIVIISAVGFGAYNLFIYGGDLLKGPKHQAQTDAEFKQFVDNIDKKTAQQPPQAGNAGPPPQARNVEQIAESNAESLAFSSAIALFNQQQFTRALMAFDSFINNYPSSPRTPIAKQRMADIQRIIDAQNAKIVAETHAAERGIADEFAKSRALSVRSGARDGHGVFNYPGTVIVKGLAKQRQRLLKLHRRKCLKARKQCQ